jgi:hypothetical protein
MSMRLSRLWQVFLNKAGGLEGTRLPDLMDVKAMVLLVTENLMGRLWVVWKDGVSLAYGIDRFVRRRVARA